MPLYVPNDDAIGNHLEPYGYEGWYEGWPEMQEDEDGYILGPEWDEEDEND